MKLHFSTSLFYVSKRFFKLAIKNKSLITEAGGRDGWAGEGLVFKAGRKDGDYHEEMNSKVFEEWVRT